MHERSIMRDGPVRSGRPDKRSLSQELSNLRVDVATLRADNERSHDVIDQWVEKKRNGGHFIVYGCSDSRVLRIFPGESSVMVPSIAAAGHDDYRTEMKHKGKVIAVHHPCGGAHAKEHEHELPESNLKEYVKKKIRHANVVKQALHEANEAIQNSDEPVLAVVVDQENGNVIPIAYFEATATLSGNRRRVIHGKVADNLRDFDPSKQALSQIPALEMGEVGVFAEYLQDIKDHKEGFLASFHDLSEQQKTQNPPVLVIDTEENPPLPIRYPSLSAPGSAFRIAVEGDGTLEGSLPYYDTVLDQAEYPLGNFNNLQTVVVQTPSIETSQVLANKFLKREKGSEWFAKKETQIIIIGSTDGKIDEISAMPKTPVTVN